MTASAWTAGWRCSTAPAPPALQDRETFSVAADAPRYRLFHEPCTMYEAGDLFQRARLFKQVRRAGDNLELAFHSKLTQSFLVHANDRRVGPTHDQ